MRHLRPTPGNVTGKEPSPAAWRLRGEGHSRRGDVSPRRYPTLAPPAGYRRALYPTTRGAAPRPRILADAGGCQVPNVRDADVCESSATPCRELPRTGWHGVLIFSGKTLPACPRRVSPDGVKRRTRRGRKLTGATWCIWKRKHGGKLFENRPKKARNK